VFRRHYDTEVSLHHANIKKIFFDRGAYLAARAVRFARALRAASFLALGGRAVANTEHTSVAFRALTFDCRAAILHFDSLRVGNFALGLALNTISSGHFILDIENFARQNNARAAKKS
jgi:hypothetical protein